MRVSVFPNIKGPLLIEPKRILDERGYFQETYNKRAAIEAGLDCDFVQDNSVFSKSAGTLRGLHFQAPPFAQAKLVSCPVGEVIDVIVDLRKGSPAFGQWLRFELSQQNGLQLYVPEGFAHGYITRSADCLVTYKVSAYYNASSEFGIDPFCKTLAIDWSVEAQTLSGKDKTWPGFEEFKSPF